MISPGASAACPSCGQPLAPDAVFCHHCGHQLLVRCPTCTAANPDESRYCHRCGNRLPTQAPQGAAGQLEEPVSQQGSASAVEPRQPAVPVACPRCRSANDLGSRFCYSCGLPLDDAVSLPGQILRSAEGDVIGTPAGFWIRALALIIDSILLTLIGMVIYIVLGEPLFPDTVQDASTPFPGLLTTTADRLSLLVDVAYFVLGWSMFGTTVGKRLFGLYVVRPDGSRIGFWRALWRYFARDISGLLLLAGFLMVAFRSDKRGLHDLLADTYVLKRP